MQCKDIMLSHVYRCRESDTARRCAGIMRDEKIGFVPVVDKDDKVVGVITDRDLVVRLLASGRSSLTSVAKLMTVGELLTCRSDEDLRTLEARMAKAKKARAMVVDAEGKCVGVISLSDIAQAEEAGRAGRLLNDIAHRESVQIARP
jgi:CBS domain-containing protein